MQGKFSGNDKLMIEVCYGLFAVWYGGLNPEDFLQLVKQCARLTEK